MKARIQIKRVYDDAADGDGVRVLVDRLWPRGMSKDRARIDEWLKDLAPSSELRRRFGHDPRRWEAFRAAYFEELDANPETVARLRAMADDGPVTLVYAAKDERHNNAVALKDYLEGRKEEG